MLTSQCSALLLAVPDGSSGSRRRCLAGSDVVQKPLRPICSCSAVQQLPNTAVGTRAHAHSLLWKEISDRGSTSNPLNAGVERSLRLTIADDLLCCFFSHRSVFDHVAILTLLHRECLAAVSTKDFTAGRSAQVFMYHVELVQQHAQCHRALSASASAGVLPRHGEMHCIHHHHL